MQNSLINLSICLSDIDKKKIKKAKNGKLYMGLTIKQRKEPDQYGQDVYSYIAQTKEEREAKAEKIYVGNGKLVNFNENVGEMSEAPVEDTDDLPF